MNETLIGIAVVAIIASIPTMALLLGYKLDKIAEERKTKRKWGKR